MGMLTQTVLNRLTATGPRLPWLASWLMTDVWSGDRYEALAPGDYLQQGEKLVNDMEEVVLAASDRLYGELLAPPTPDRDLLKHLCSQPSAAVVFDGLSLREVPLIAKLAKESRLRVVEAGWSTAAAPSETVDFIAQRLWVGRIGPSQLANCGELKRQGVACYFLEQVNQQRAIDPGAQGVLIWSSFPDYRYKERDAKFAELFEHLHNMMTTAWQNSVQEIARVMPGRRILVTSDHGYVFFGPGCSMPWDNDAIRPLTDYLGGDRHAVLAEKPEPPEHRGLAVLKDRGVAMIRGRVQTHPRGEASRKLYKHGGLSLMEMLTPWVLLERDGA